MIENINNFNFLLFDHSCEIDATADNASLKGLISGDTCFVTSTDLIIFDVVNFGISGIFSISSTFAFSRPLSLFSGCLAVTFGGFFT